MIQYFPDFCGQPNSHFTHLKVGIVVIRVFGLSDLHCRAWFLHELASSESQTTHHALAAALQHLLENLVIDKRKHIITLIQGII